MSRASLATVELILESAHKVLVAHGYAKFTMRRVAEAAGISSGNLAYHYPYKQILLQALVRRMLADYLNKFEALLADPDQTFDQGMSQIVRWIMLDSVAEETVRTFREIWAISLHDEVICEAVDDMYDELMRGVAELLRRFRPDADIQLIHESVQLLALISEGTAVLYGTRLNRAVPQGRIIEIVTRLLDSHVSTGDLHRSIR